MVIGKIRCHKLYIRGGISLKAKKKQRGGERGLTERENTVRLRVDYTNKAGEREGERERQGLISKGLAEQIGDT
jgi:hypothetical protein